MEVLKMSGRKSFIDKDPDIRDHCYPEDSFSGGKLPSHIQFIRSGINNRYELNKFVQSEGNWAGIDVRIDRTNDKLIVRNYPFEKKPPSAREDFLSLNECLEELLSYGKSVQVNIKEGGYAVESIIDELGDFNISNDALIINSGIDVLTGHQFINLSKSFPGSVIQCKADFIHTILPESSLNAVKILNSLSSWGVNRFSFDWGAVREKKVADFMSENGYQVNFYNVNDLDNLINAILMVPGSITHDFDLSESDEFRVYSQYRLRTMDLGFAIGR